MKYACVIVLRVCVIVLRVCVCSCLRPFRCKCFFIARCVFTVDCKQLRYEESPHSLCQVCHVACEFLLERERETAPKVSPHTCDRCCHVDAMIVLEIQGNDYFENTVQSFFQTLLSVTGDLGDMIHRSPSCTNSSN